MDATKLIDLLGGTTKVAEICDVTPGAVSQWKNNGIPKPWLRFFESQHPEVFNLPELKDTPPYTETTQEAA
ncbi:hypothetical protein UNDYM_1637 [Undibacterium sp. YM2]|uniref:Cro/CI family transcriptional regulator n=1 Tax=Undibacterium sp. YM2 TaxID=2058625 RepID=UPI001331E9CF|nr:Cro/CI family transcriptional regulator [Undibacterium sp. YM2]BBB65890.1 hypothetical protein UNDYM_1637 [Undibacterium sp. YM2]